MALDRDVYRALFDANPLPMFVSDRDTLQILMVNRAACEHYGWSEVELLAMTIRDIRPREEIHAFEAAFAVATKDAVSKYSRAGRHRTKDGRVIDVTLEITRMMLGDRPASLAVVTDVTGVAQAERRFRLLVEHCAEGIVLTNADRVVEYVSPAGQRILGYRADEVVGMSARSRTHPDDAERFPAPAPGETKNYISRVSHRDGSWRWVESSTTNLTHDPAVRAYVSNYRDITERKLADEALLESQSRLRYLLSATAAVTYSARAYGDFGATFISSNVRAVLGYEPSEFITNARFWMDNIHPDDRPIVEADVAVLVEQGEMVLTYRFRDSAGGYRWMRDSARIVRDGNGAPIEVVGYWVDVTEQVRAEQALRRSEENFRALIERAPFATFVHRDGRYIYVNQAAVTLLGYHSAADIVGTLVLDSIHPDDRETIRSRMA
ncbi:MAG TPA: PAS domain S-box protein, partial [Kofleriaceae bacterium]|nr:PAS domain S-box protein [Kofleriaceae bacterium]